MIKKCINEITMVTSLYIYIKNCLLGIEVLLQRSQLKNNKIITTLQQRALERFGYITNLGLPLLSGEKFYRLVNQIILSYF